MSETSDGALVEAIRAGDVARFAEVVGRHDRRVRAVIVGCSVREAADVEDLVQKAFYLAFCRREPRRGGEEHVRRRLPRVQRPRLVLDFPVPGEKRIDTEEITQGGGTDRIRRGRQRKGAEAPAPRRPAVDPPSAALPRPVAAR